MIILSVPIKKNVIKIYHILHEYNTFVFNYSHLYIYLIYHICIYIYILIHIYCFGSRMILKTGTLLSSHKIINDNKKSYIK